MNGLGHVANGARFLTVISRKRFMVSAFRVVAWLVAVAHLSFFTTDSNDLLPPQVLIIAATLYTGLKLLEPVRWYQSKAGLAALLLLDVAACVALVELSGELHGPFGLYSLAPVVTGALLVAPKITLITAAVTGVYMTLFLLRNPLPESVDYLAGRLAVYVMALGLTAALPYIVNAGRERQLRSSGMVGERRRIGREIHDGFCQTVYGLRWQLRALKSGSYGDVRLAEKVKHLETLLELAESEARSFVELLGSFRAERPLMAQLQESLDHLRDDTGIDCCLDIEGSESTLDDIVKLEVLYVCEEALRNVAKHSSARRVSVKVQWDKNTLRVVVADDGRGIDDTSSKRGHGLTVMQERVESIGGRFRVTSAAGQGTEINLEVPKRCPLGLPQAG